MIFNKYSPKCYYGRLWVLFSGMHLYEHALTPYRFCFYIRIGTQQATQKQRAFTCDRSIPEISSFITREIDSVGIEDELKIHQSQ